MDGRSYGFWLIGGTLVMLNVPALLGNTMNLENYILLREASEGIWTVGLLAIVILRIAHIDRSWWLALLIFVPFGILILGFIPASTRTTNGDK